MRSRLQSPGEGRGCDDAEKDMAYAQLVLVQWDGYMYTGRVVREGRPVLLVDAARRFRCVSH